MADATPYMVKLRLDRPGRTDKRRTARAAALSVSLLMLSGCSAAVCPSDVQDLHDPALRARIGSGFIAGTAIVNRYVDSPDPGYRGYDLEITSRIAGLAEADQVMFALAQTPLPNIELGAEVLVVGRRGPQVNDIQAAGCPVLTPARPQ